MARVGANNNPRNLSAAGVQHIRPGWFITLGAASKGCAFNAPSANPADDNTKLVDNKL